MSYKDSIMNTTETVFWEPGDFLLKNELPKTPLIDGITIFSNNSLHILQTNGFSEFDNLKVVDLTGYNAKQMKENGCGITCLYMTLLTLSPNSLDDKNIKTVGNLAIYALSFHRNDLKKEEDLIKRGTPVLNLKSGWYHDALIFVTKEIDSNIEGFRVHKLKDENQRRDFFSYCRTLSQDKDIVIISSIFSNRWSNKVADSSVQTHLIIINGIEAQNQEIKRVRVTDPYKFHTEVKDNQWVDYDPSLFTGNFIVLFKKKG